MIDGGFEALLESIHIAERDRGKRPHLLEPSAEHAACVIEVSEQGLRSGEDRAAGRVEVLVHRDVDSIEQRRILTHGAIGVDAFEEQARAVEMQSNVPLAGPSGDFLYLLK